MIHYDFENALAAAGTLYFAKVADPAITAACPVVAFYDPSSIGEDDRVVIDVPSCDTMAESPGNFTATLEVIIKTRWNQPTLGNDYGTHTARVNEFRDKLMSPTLADDLDASSVGIGIDFVQPVRHFRTTIREGWFISETQLEINGFFINTP